MGAQRATTSVVRTAFIFMLICELAIWAPLPRTAHGQDGSIPLPRLRDWQDHNNNGWLALRRGNLDRAAKSFRLAVETVRPYQAKEGRLLARSMADYARVLVLQRRCDEAEPLARWAVTVCRADPRTKPSTLADDLLLLARIDRRRGRLDLARPLLEEALAIQEKAVGPVGPALVPLLEELADAHAAEGRPDESVRHYRRALAVRDAFHERSLQEAAELEQRADDLLNATRLIGGTIPAPSFRLQVEVERLRAEASERREVSAESSSAALAVDRQAVVLRRTGRVEEAEDLEARARAIRDAVETRAARAASNDH